MSRRPTRNIVISYIASNPDSSSDEICEALFMDPTGAHFHLNALVKDGVLTRRRDRRMYRYSMVSGNCIAPSDEGDAVESATTKADQAEKIARCLAEKGLYRRAATVLTEVIGMLKTEREVQRVSRIRHQCLMSAKRQNQGVQA